MHTNGHVLDDVSVATVYATLDGPALPWPFVHAVHAVDPTVGAYEPAPHAPHDVPLGMVPMGHKHVPGAGSPVTHTALVQIPAMNAMLLV